MNVQPCCSWIVTRIDVVLCESTGMDKKNSQQQRRRALRLPALMKGMIVAPNQIAPAPCLVHNASPHGAKLKIDEGWIIPRSFWLRIEGDPELRYCTVVWRDAFQLGVSFTQKAEKQPWPTDRTNLSLLLRFR